MSEWVHIAVEIVGVTCSVLLAAWRFRRQDRKEREEIRAAAEIERQKLHAENIRKFDILLTEQNERPNHRHMEDRGPLTVGGIRYAPPKRFNSGT